MLQVAKYGGTGVRCTYNKDVAECKPCARSVEECLCVTIENPKELYQEFCLHCMHLLIDVLTICSVAAF